MPALPWTREDDRKFNSHALDVVATLTGGAAYQDQGHDRVFDGTGGLSIDRRTGQGYVYTRGLGHPFTRVAVLEIWKGWSREEAILWARAYLDNHREDGSCTGADDLDDIGGVYGSVSREMAEETLARFRPAADTPGQTWLRSRGFEPPYPEDIGFVEYARTGEHAVVARLRAPDGRITGVEVRFIEPAGAPTTLKLDRVRYNLEPHKQAAFRLPAPEGPPDVTVDRIITEGFPDALTAAKLGRKCKIEGIPGCGFLVHVKAAAGEKITLFRDGDNDEAYIAGVDALVRQKAIVRVSPTLTARDINSIYLESGYGALEALFIKAKPIPTGEITRLAQIDPIQAELELPAVAKATGVGISVLRKAIDMARRDQARTARKAAAEAEAAAKEAARKRAEDPEWDGDINLAAALDTFVRVTRKSVIAPEHYFDIAALWSAASYIPALDHLELQVMPQLGVRSPKAIGENAGKSILLEAVTTAAYRGELRSSYTPATIFRSIAAEAKTFALVDIHNHELRDPSELKQIINACHKRAEAKVDRCEKLEEGSIIVCTYQCWAGLAWTSIGPLPREIESRAIILEVKRATAEEFARLDKRFSPSQSSELIDVRRQLLAWSKILRHLPWVTVELSNRDFDNWRILYQIAELAGGDWPQRVREARRKLAEVEQLLSVAVRLLGDIYEIFATQFDLNRVKSKDLIDALTRDVEKGWTEANHGRPINEWWLREHLFGLVSPSSSQKWRERNPQTGKDDHVRGYTRGQFADCFSRYVSADSVSSATSAAGTSKHVDLSGEYAAADESDPGVHPPHPGSGPEGVPDAVADDPDVVADESASTIHPPHSFSSENNELYTSAADVADEVESNRGIGKKKRANGGSPPVAGAAGAGTVTEDGGNGKAKPQKPARRAPNGGQAELGIPPPTPPEYRPGSIAAAIQQLRLAYPKRSVKWIAHQIGQPKSVVEAVLSGLKPDAAEAAK